MPVVRSLFAPLVRRETDIAGDLPGLLARACGFKEQVGYGGDGERTYITYFTGQPYVISELNGDFDR